MEKDVVNVLDVSSFLLFEATGDSEDDCDPIMGDIGRDIAMADDDAESCSYDLSDSPRVEELDDCDLQQYVHDKYKEDDGHEEDEDQEGHSYQIWGGEHDWKLTGCSKKSRGPSVDSSKELMTEEEKSRLFWEACLAS